jgi:hypothetical protein
VARMRRDCLKWLSSGSSSSPSSVARMRRDCLKWLSSGSSSDDDMAQKRWDIKQL